MHRQQQADRNTYIQSRANGSLMHLLNSADKIAEFDYLSNIPLCLSHETRDSYGELIREEVQDFYRGDKMADNGTGNVYNANPDKVETVNVSFSPSHNDKQGDLLDRLLSDCTHSAFDNCSNNNLFFIKHLARWKGNTFHPEAHTRSTVPVNRVRLATEMRKCAKSRSYKLDMFKRLIMMQERPNPIYSPFPRIAKSFYTHEHGTPQTLFDINQDSTNEYETTVYKGVYPFKADSTADVHIKPVTVCGDNTTHYPKVDEGVHRAPISEPSDYISIDNQGRALSYYNQTLGMLCPISWYF